MHPILGFIATIIIAVAYIPQIHHLLVKKCAGGVSLAMYIIWDFATILLLTHSLTGDDLVFKIFTISNGVAILIITILAIKYRDNTCPIHAHH